MTVQAQTQTIISHSPEETRRVAADLVPHLQPGAIVALYGPLGAGKTCWVQGLAHALHVEAPVTSPTYTLANEYHGRLPIYHLDLYRIASSEEALDMGFDEYLEGKGITVIEWAERAAALLPSRTIHIAMEAGDRDDERRLSIRRPAP